MKARYYYHLTKNHGKLVILEPRQPLFENEPPIPRICVAPTLRCCIVAAPASTQAIYRTKTPVVANMPYGVFDSRRTHERWLTKPTEFIRVGLLISYNHKNTFDDNWQRIAKKTLTVNVRTIAKC